MRQPWSRANRTRAPILVRFSQSLSSRRNRLVAAVAGIRALRGSGPSGMCSRIDRRRQKKLHLDDWHKGMGENQRPVNVVLHILRKRPQRAPGASQPMLKTANDERRVAAFAATRSRSTTCRGCIQKPRHAAKAAEPRRAETRQPRLCSARERSPRPLCDASD